MKYISFILVILQSFMSFSQENKELKKIKCLNKVSRNYEDFQKQDTIYILYHKSNRKDFEQHKIENIKYAEDSYQFYGYLHFPMDIYDLDVFKKINYRDPIVTYKSKNFICKNIHKVIDVYFLKMYEYKLPADFWHTKKIIFIIDLDEKIKNKYKVVQVGKPIYIQE